MIDSVPSPYLEQRRRLGRFSRLDVPPALADAERLELREILQTFNQVSDYQTIGVCAAQATLGKAALEAYVAALSQPVKLTLSPVEGPVFFKFNTLNGAWYVDSYSGPSRGVLITFHASDPDVDVINGTYGPLPLDLFS
ncbi:MAG: DUF1824 family protein [Leptolyngbyaceae cyanobacterium]